MAVILHSALAAEPITIQLPSGPIRLTCSLSSDLGGEPASLVYDLDGRLNVQFKTANGPAEKIEIDDVQITGDTMVREDVVELIEIGGGTEVAQVKIDLVIRAENVKKTSVTLAVQQ